MNFGPTFINQHLMPLLEEILVDAREGTKPYLQHELLLTGMLSVASKQDFINYYFLSRQGDKGVTPFTATEQSKEREQFLKHFIQYMRSRGSNPTERAQLFLPEKGKDGGGVLWRASVKRNLFLLSYSMAQQFEHDKIKELIDAQKDEVKEKGASRATTKESGFAASEAFTKQERDLELLAQGKLILVASESDAENFNTYVSIEDLKPGENVTTFVPPPSPEILEEMELGKIHSEAIVPVSIKSGDRFVIPATSSTQTQMVTDLQRRQAVQMVNNLAEQELLILEEPQYDAAGNLSATVKSGSQTFTVTINVKMPGEESNYHFTLVDGKEARASDGFPGAEASKKEFTLMASQLQAAFNSPQGGKKEALQVFEELRHQKDFKLTSAIGVSADSSISGAAATSYSNAPGSFRPSRPIVHTVNSSHLRRATAPAKVKELPPPFAAAQALAAQRKIRDEAGKQRTFLGHTGAAAVAGNVSSIPSAPAATKGKKGLTAGTAALIGNIAAGAAAVGLATYTSGSETIGYTLKMVVVFLGHSIG